MEDSHDMCMLPNAQAGMSFLEVFLKVGAFAKEAISINFWGLGCPPHCHSSSMPLLILTFGFGLSVGFGLAVTLWIFLTCPEQAPPKVSFASRPEFTRARRRLLGYTRQVHE